MSKPLSPNFFINPRCPPGVVPAVAASIDVHYDEVTNVPDREVPAAEVRSGKDLAFSE